MSQQIVAAGGAGLIALELWTGGGRKTIADGLFNENADALKQHAAHAELVKLGGGVLLIGIMALAAGQSAAWSSAMTAIIVGLFLVWSVNHYGKA